VKRTFSQNIVKQDIAPKVVHHLIQGKKDPNLQWVRKENELGQ